MCTLDLTSVKVESDDEKRIVVVRRADVLIAFNFSDEEQSVKIPQGHWRPLIDSGVKTDGTRLVVPASGFALMRA